METPALLRDLHWTPLEGPGRLRCRLMNFFSPLWDLIAEGRAQTAVRSIKSDLTQNTTGTGIGRPRNGRETGWLMSRVHEFSPETLSDLKVYCNSPKPTT